MGINLLGHQDETYYDLHASIYDLILSGQEGDVEFYLEEARRAGHPVLELAVGTGRVAIPVAQAGIPVVGIDRSPAMLAQARRKARDAGLEADRLQLLQADMQTFRLSQHFGLAYIPYRGFLHLMNPEEQKQALGNIHSHLQEGGRLVLNFFVPDLSVIAAHLTPLGAAFLRQIEAPGESGRALLISGTKLYDPYTQRIEELWSVEEVDTDGQVVNRRYLPLKLRWIYRYEMEHLLELCGFEVEALYGWFDRRPFDAESREMVWICRKK